MILHLYVSVRLYQPPPKLIWVLPPLPKRAGLHSTGTSILSSAAQHSLAHCSIIIRTFQVLIYVYLMQGVTYLPSLPCVSPKRVPSSAIYMHITIHIYINIIFIICLL